MTVEIVNLSRDAEEGSRPLLFEFQGKIETALPESKGALLGHYNESGSTFTIGKQLLKGKRVKLSKPLAVVRKHGDGFAITDVISEKTLFDARPSTII